MSGCPVTVDSVPFQELVLLLPQYPHWFPGIESKLKVSFLLQYLQYLMYFTSLLLTLFSWLSPYKFWFHFVFSLCSSNVVCQNIGRPIATMQMIRRSNICFCPIPAENNGDWRQIYWRRRMRSQVLLELVHSAQTSHIIISVMARTCTGTVFQKVLWVWFSHIWNCQCFVAVTHCLFPLVLEYR